MTSTATMVVPIPRHSRVDTRAEVDCLVGLFRPKVEQSLGVGPPLIHAALPRRVQEGVHRQAAGYIACSGAPHTVAHDAQSHVGLGKLYVEIILILLSDHTLIGAAPYVHG
jgi:hypothetical protein